MRLVLVHGSMSSSAQWADYPDLLPEFDVVTPDLPGHGDRAGEAFSTQAAIDAIDEAVGDQPAFVGGHSLGGYLASRYAGERPPAGLIVMSATANPRGPVSAPYRAFAKLTERVSHERLGRARLAIAGRLGVPSGHLPSNADYQALPDVWRSVHDDCPPRVLIGVPCPVLFINGQFDQMRVDERRYRSLVPGSRLEIVARASHFAPLTHAPAVADLIRSFVSQAPRG